MKLIMVVGVAVCLARVGGVAVAAERPGTEKKAAEKPIAEKAAAEKPAAPATAGPPAGGAAPTATDTTPDALAEKIEDLLNSEGENPENEKEFSAYWSKQLAAVDGLISEFRAKFPTHPLRWKLLMHEANAREIREELEIPLPKGSRTAADIYAEILAAPDADATVKAQASSARLIGLSDQVAEKKVTLADWENQLAAHMKTFPDFEDNMVLIEMRLMLVEEHANARLVPLLEELSKSKVPEIAELASSRLASAKMMAELKAKPLDLTFKAVDGSEVDLQKLRGKVVLIDFWATWCGPCMAELPNVIKAYEKYKEKGFEIIGISLDEDKADLARVLKTKKITWPQYFDGKGWENPYAKKYGIEGIPTMWLVNKAGMVTDTDATEELAEKIEKLLGE